MVYNNDLHFCRSKLLLEPEDASFFDLILLLFSSDIKKRKFVDCNEEQRWQDFASRWIIFISVLAQKFLRIIKKPLAFTGKAVEITLNLLSNNGGFFGLLMKIITGSPVVKPDPASATFTSVVGNLDTRVEMDKNIEVGDTRYTAFLAWMASKFVYENEAFISNVITNLWKMEFKGFYKFWNGYLQDSSTTAFMMADTTVDPNLIVVAFRGTYPFDADGWSSDIDLSWYGLEGVGQIHRGFMKALGLQKNGWPKHISPLKHHSYAYYQWRRRLYSWEVVELENLLLAINNAIPRESYEDKILWDTNMEPFSVQRCCRSLEEIFFPGTMTRSINVWKRPGAPKWQSFMWLACLDKIMAKGFLARLGVINPSEDICLACGDREENASHILINCRVAWNCWSLLMKKWGICWVQPRTVIELFDQWSGLGVPKKWQDLWYAVLFATAWSIWLGRNERIFRQRNKSPQDLFIDGLIHGLAWAKMNLKGIWMDGMQLLPSNNFIQLLQH